MCDKTSPHFYHYSYDSSYDIKLYNNLVEKYCVNIDVNTKTIFNHQICSDYNDNIDENILFVVEEAKKRLLSNGFKIKDKFYVEFWSYKCFTSIETPLCIHQDDYGAVDYPVETCIFYTQFDKDLEDGNLEIYNNFEEMKECVYIKEGDIILLSGNLNHKPQNVKGNGIRNCIVVQIESSR